MRVKNREKEREKIEERVCAFLIKSKVLENEVI